MLNLVATLEEFESLMQQCQQISLRLLEHPASQHALKEELITMRSDCDALIQDAVLKGIFPSPLSELDILRKQYLDLSKELYQAKISGAPAYKTEAISNVLNSLLLQIKQLENVDPASLMLD